MDAPLPVHGTPWKAQPRHRMESLRWVQDGADILLSAPHTVFLGGGEHAVIAGAPSIVMHISSRVFASARKSPAQATPGFDWRPPIWGERYSHEVESGPRDALIEYLSAACKYFGLCPHVEIRVFSEGVPSGGANASGALCSLVSACLLWSSDLIEEDDITAISHLSPEEISFAFNSKRFLTSSDHGLRMLDDPTIHYEPADKAAAVITLSWALESCCCHQHKASAYGAFVPLVNVRGPFVFFPQQRSMTPSVSFAPAGHNPPSRQKCGPFDLRDASPPQPPRDEQRSATALADISRTASNISRLHLCAWTLPTCREPLDVACGVFYTGVPKNTGRQINATMEMPANRAHSLLTMAKFADAVQTAMPKELQAFRSLCVKPKELLFDPRQWELMGILVEVHEAVRGFLANAGRLESVAKGMRRVQGALVSWGLDWHEGDAVARTVYAAAGKENYDRTAVKMTGGGGGGCVVWLSPRDCADDIQSRLLALAAELEDSGSVEYSRSGWPEARGLMCEARLMDGSEPEGAASLCVPTWHNMVAESTHMRQVVRQIKQFSQVIWPVLIEGESGTGKELVARAIHDLSNRADGLFLDVNCNDLTKDLAGSALFGHEAGAFTGATEATLGHFRVAEGGTLFLDEIGDLSMEVQGKLLRAVDRGRARSVGGESDYPVNVRVVSATNRDLKAEVEAGRFRLDLFARISTLGIQLEPLRRRKEDILPLAEMFFEDARLETSKTHVQGFSTEAKALLVGHDWTLGNIRRLRKVVRRALLSCQGALIMPGDLDLEEGTTMGSGEYSVGRPGNAGHAGGRSLDREMKHISDTEVREAYKAVGGGGATLDALQEALGARSPGALRKRLKKMGLEYRRRQA